MGLTMTGDVLKLPFSPLYISDVAFVGRKFFLKLSLTLNSRTENFVFVSESDMGAFRPLTYNSKLLFKGLGIYMNKIRNIVRILNEMDIPLTVVSSDDQVHKSVYENIIL